ncbi:ABC transporter ATP-binding protein [candidate division KSB1 bacterium]|nr:MAG: ABC transporter ATP-binding protein [candidate division KSB1 bacterium]
MIEIRSLYKSFRDKQVLRGVDLTIENGESITIIGQSGCGKSVLLKHLVGLLQPESGAVIVDGRNITTAKRKELYDIRKRFGVLFQGAALFDSMTVEENVSLALRTHTNQETEKIAQRVEECLTLVSMNGTQKLKPAELSGGMKKRVGLARAIAMQPSYILYDEPTTGLDPITADSINDLIIHLNHELNVTTVVVTHDMVSAYKISNRIVMLHKGQIIFSGTPEETQHTTIDIVHRFVTGQADEQPYVITRY